MMAKHCRIVNFFISRVDSVFKLMPCVKNSYQQIPTIWIAVWLREDLASNQVRITSFIPKCLILVLVFMKSIFDFFKEFLKVGM